jgi:hypothetical protein
MASDIPAPFLRTTIQAQLPARRPQSRLNKPLAPQRLAHAERRLSVFMDK